MAHKFYKHQGILECEVYSVKNSELEKKMRIKEQNERLGIENDEDDEEDVYGEPIKMVLDFNQMGGICFFTPNKSEIYEEGNFVEGTYVEFESDLNFVLLIEFDTFKNIYYEYKGIINGN